MRGMLLTIGLLNLPALANAQQGFAYTWAKGDTATYKTRQATTVVEAIIEKKDTLPKTVTTTTDIATTKVWTVTSSDDKGAALELKITALKQDVEQTVGDAPANKRQLDSAKPDDAKEMPFLNTPSFRAVLDRTGEVLSLGQDAKTEIGRVKAEPPFRLILPKKPVAANDTWKRTITVKTASGESYDAEQTYTLKGQKDDFVVVALTTKLMKPPDDNAVLPMLMPMLWEGELFLNAKSNRYHGARLKVNQEVNNHRGEGTKFRYSSEYTEAAE